MSARCLGALLFASLTICVGDTQAGEQSFRAEAGVSVLRFNYQEFDGAGSLLDTERGGIPGLSLNLEWRKMDWTVEGATSYHFGKVIYDGQTNYGAPYSTLTNERTSDTTLRAGMWFGTSYRVMPFVGIGYRRWDRDILPASLGGLFESYQWPYLWIGTKVSLTKNAATNHVLDIGLIRPIKPEMWIDFKGAFNASPHVYPESRTGLRCTLTSNLMITKNLNLILEPFYEYWALGKSPVVTQNTISVYEPASKTNNVGVNIRIGRNF